MAALSRRYLGLRPAIAALLLPLILAACQTSLTPTTTPQAPGSDAMATSTVAVSPPKPVPSPTTTPTPAPTSTATPTPRSAEVERVAGVPRNESLVLTETEPTTLDPALVRDAASNQYVAQIFSGLVRLDEDLRLKPDIAEKWEVLDGGTRYVFHIRPNVRFHSGRTVTAHDFVFSLERAANPALDSGTAQTYLSDIIGVNEKLAGTASAVQGIRAIDDARLEITIDAPKPYFLAKLTYPVAFVVDQENVRAGPDWYRQPNGTGPFRLKAWEKEQHIVLERNQDFYRATRGVKYVVFRLFAGSPIQLYESGEIDVAQVGVGSLGRILDPQSGLYQELRVYGELSVSYIGFNTATPPFDDPQVRRAFAMALDVGRLANDVQEGFVQRAKGFLPPGMPGSNPGVQGIAFNPALAKALLRQSQYGSAQELPPITYTTSGLDQLDATISAAIAMWRANLGVEVAVRQIPSDEYVTRLNDEVDNLFDFGWVADYPDPENILDVLFHSDRSSNIGDYSNSAVDALLEQARTEGDIGQRMQLYQAAQRLLLQDAAAIPLWHSNSYVLVKPYVKGFALTTQGLPTLENVLIERG